MKRLKRLTDDQHDTIDWLFYHDASLLDGKMGGGKTICTLTAISDMLADGNLKRVLIVAPKKVAQTVWQEEAADWSHTKHLKVAKALGSAKERLHALDSDADVVVINFENLVWLMDLIKKGRFVFDGLVIDELTKLKSAGGRQFKALRHRLKMFTWRVGLTGTAVSENWEGLYAMMMVLDDGARLGTRKDAYLKKYFYELDYEGYNLELHPWAAAAISEMIRDVVYTMPDYRGELPPPLFEIIPLAMPSEVLDVYKELMGKMVVTVEGEDIEAPNAAVLSGKLQQLANGFLYLGDDESGKDKPFNRFSDFRHTALLNALEDSDGPTMVVCWYTADLRTLLENIPHAVELNSGAGVEANVLAWNRGDIDVLLMHPRSAGHGLNLAQGGAEIIWFSPVWSRDLWEQTNARLWRRGQLKTVRVREIVCLNSIDELVRQRVEDKAEFEALWLEHLGGG